MKNLIVLIMATLVTVGCANGPIDRQNQGIVGGALIGGILGSQIGDGSGQVIAAAAGAIGGALVGSHLGKKLDERDELAMRLATNNALEFSQVNHPTQWSNPDSGNRGAVVPTRTFQTSNGNYCREFTSEVNVGGKSETAHGTACRTPDGNWMIAS